jgi:CARDB
MKKTFATIVAFSAILFLPTLSAFAAGITLTNGGLGQAASTPNQFGVAVCNTGATALSQSVPVSVTVNGQSQTISSASSIAVGACAYAYLPYSQFNMQPGTSYTAQVVIDPGATVISNTNNSASYSITVPGTPATADVSAQSGNIFIAFWNWFKGLFSHL